MTKDTRTARDAYMDHHEATVALLQRTPKPTDDDIDRSITNACRCGTYHRIRQAIHKAAAMRA